MKTMEQDLQLCVERSKNIAIIYVYPKCFLYVRFMTEAPYQGLHLTSKSEGDIFRIIIYTTSET